MTAVLRGRYRNKQGAELIVYASAMTTLRGLGALADDIAVAKEADPIFGPPNQYVVTQHSLDAAGYTLLPEPSDSGRA